LLLIATIAIVANETPVQPTAGTSLLQRSVHVA